MATTTDRSAQELLRSAAGEVEAALALLDMRSSMCPECGLKHFANKIHGRLGEQLSGMPDKLRRVADKLDEELRQSTL